MEGFPPAQSALEKEAVHHQNVLKVPDLMYVSTLERVQRSIQKHGSIYTYEHIYDLAMGAVPAEQHNADWNRLEINDISAPSGCSNPLDLIIRIGNTEVPHWTLIGCDFGCVALGAVFGLEFGAIRRIAKYRMGYREQEKKGRVTFSGERRWIHWAGLGDNEGYSIRQLMETAAGIAVLGEQQTKECRRRLPQHFHVETSTSTLDRLADVIQASGIEAAWDCISDIAPNHLVKRRGQEGDFKIHDFYRPDDYATLADLMMVVANTDVRLGLLCASDIGCALLQQLLSIKDVRGQRISMVSAEKIKKNTAANHTNADSPYLVHVSAEHLYISWKSAGWWEAYDLCSLDDLVRKALGSLPYAVLRPQPPSAWIKKYRPTVRHPVAPWNFTVPSPKESNVTMAERRCRGIPLQSTGVAVRSTPPLTGRTHDKIPLASFAIKKQACEKTWMANRDSLAPCVYHATEPLSPMVTCGTRAEESVFRRLWRRLICM